MDESLLPIIRDFVSELAEIAGGSVLPIKAAGDATKLVFGISDRILFLKVTRFLEGIPFAKQQEFAQKLRDNEHFRKNTVEHLLITLDKMDDMDKADIISKVFCSYLDEKINSETFKRLFSSINASFIEDLRRIVTAVPGELEPFLPCLLRAGLSEIFTRPQDNAWNAKDVVASYRLNLLGKIFQQIMRDQPITGI